MLRNRSGSGGQSCLQGDLPQGAIPLPQVWLLAGRAPRGTLDRLAGQQPWHRPLEPEHRPMSWMEERPRPGAGTGWPPRATRAPPATLPCTRSARWQEQPCGASSGMHTQGRHRVSCRERVCGGIDHGLATRCDRENHVCSYNTGTCPGLEQGLGVRTHTFPTQSKWRQSLGWTPWARYCPGHASPLLQGVGGPLLGSGSGVKDAQPNLGRHCRPEVPLTRLRRVLGPRQQMTLSSATTSGAPGSHGFLAAGGAGIWPLEAHRPPHHPQTHVSCPGPQTADALGELATPHPPPRTHVRTGTLCCACMSPERGPWPPSPPLRQGPPPSCGLQVVHRGRR